MAAGPRRAAGGSIVTEPPAPVNSPGRPSQPTPPGPRPGRKRRQRRQAHGSAWHWKQTDSWYYTLPGTKRRVPLFDPDGNRIRGAENKEAARLALARVRLTQQGELAAPQATG